MPARRPIRTQSAGADALIDEDTFGQLTGHAERRPRLFLPGAIVRSSRGETRPQDCRRSSRRPATGDRDVLLPLRPFLFKSIASTAARSGLLAPAEIETSARGGSSAWRRTSCRRGSPFAQYLKGGREGHVVGRR